MEDLGFSLIEEENFENRLDSYKNIYKLLPEDVKDLVVPPSRIKDLAGVEYNFSIIYDRLKLIREFPFITINPYPKEYEPNCSDEIGYQAPMSSTGINNVADNSARCAPADYHTNGLHRNSDYPLKYNTTCIKDQGNRGTCVSLLRLMLQLKQMVIPKMERHITYLSNSPIFMVKFLEDPLVEKEEDMTTDLIITRLLRFLITRTHLYNLKRDGRIIQATTWRRT